MKVKTIFSCQHCGYQSPKWLGRCPDCGNWSSFVEERMEKERASTRDILGLSHSQPPQPVNEILGTKEERFKTDIGEFDRVLGGGVVHGSLILVGGDPGIGKSTLMLQASNRLAVSGLKILYVSGEESTRQTKMRADRLGISSNDLYILSETSLEEIIKNVDKLKPMAVIIDSIQTMYTNQLNSAPGSVSQVRETTGRLMVLAKSTGIPVFLVGHVTKEGAIAGPRILEHIVDTVLYFEGDRGHPYRILRAVKNRFGSTNEIGVFEMRDVGLVEVSNPSELFLAERPDGVSGSVVVSSLEGTRPVLVELQALVSQTNFGVPRRTTIGVDHNRVTLLVAVLEKRAGLNLLGHDVFVNVAGGVRIDEPAVDLGIVVAVASSFLNKPVNSQSIIIGEVGLAGEIRMVNQAELRIKEAQKLGFTRCFLPKSNLKGLERIASMELIGVHSLQEVMDKLF